VCVCECVCVCVCVCARVCVYVCWSKVGSDVDRRVVSTIGVLDCNDVNHFRQITRRGCRVVDPTSDAVHRHLKPNLVMYVSEEVGGRARCETGCLWVQRA
jgi:hypothetical protein